MKIRFIKEDDYCKLVPSFKNANIYITKPWIDFLKKTVNGTFYFIECLREDKNKIYFYVLTLLPKKVYKQHRNLFQTPI